VFGLEVAASLKQNEVEHNEIFFYISVFSRFSEFIAWLGGAGTG